MFWSQFWRVPGETKFLMFFVFKFMQGYGNNTNLSLSHIRSNGRMLNNRIAAPSTSLAHK